ncbi:signal peptidase I [Gammaproteobacteria bacterium LSUCC0057]|uniref:Signal peptidase I n=1 Tax=Gammaproteobacteria bacterium LSUCC0057 TaxID=2559237 RepID=A0A4Y8ULI4_9GAMM|nr:signal peptidase I [Gammaproteobacteria bacterium LSUCC0057]
MDLNFELILTLLFLLSASFWILNRVWLQTDRGPVEYVASLAPVLAIVLVLRSFIIEPFQIPSSSMVPTLQKGDFIVVNKWVYGLRLPVLRNLVVPVSEPQRGDVMVFFPPHEQRYFIKRVVGLPGDKVSVVNGQLYINGELMVQSDAQPVDDDLRSARFVEDLDGYSHPIQRRLQAGRLSQNFHDVVPAGHYFMLGDNRDNSSDSRVWGPVPAERIVGKAFARWMFWDERMSLPSFDRAGRIR